MLNEKDPGNQGGLNPSVPSGSGEILSISTVERDTGITKDTLRVWERRYGFPSPQRDALGERLYSTHDLEVLRVVRRLMDLGYRPGKLLRLPLQELRSLSQAAMAAAPAPDVGVEAWNHLMELIRQDRVAALQDALARELSRMGASRFVTDLVAPLTRAVGLAWAQGSLQVYQEHAYTEKVQGLLRQCVAQVPLPAIGGRPQVLLTTLPGEPHGMGLLMAETLMRIESCQTLSLGVQTPVSDLLQAVQAHNVDIVALSFSGISAPQAVVESLVDLRRRLPGDVELWAGGAAAVLRRRSVEDVYLVSELRSITQEVDRWRSTHQPK